MEEYFDKVVKVHLKSSNRENRQSHIRISVAFRSTISAVNKELVIRITDEEDVFFLYNLVLGESDFHTLKSQQGLLVDFFAFPQKFVELLELCLEEEKHESPKFLLQMVMSTGVDHGLASLHVVETNPFKHLTHLSLKFLPGSDSEVKKYLADCLKNLQDEKLTLEKCLSDTGADLQQKLSSCQEVLAIKTQELNSLKSECLAKSSQLENKHVQELTAEREKALQVTATSQQKFEREKREIEQNHKSQVAKLETRLDELENSNRELMQKKYQAESNIRDLRSRLGAVEDEYKHAKQELHLLRRENGSLDTEKHEHTKKVSQLQTKVAVLEQELRDKEQVISRTNELLDNASEQRRNQEKILVERQEQISKLQASMKSVSGEVIKGNEIIQKLQSELRSFKSKMKLKNVVTTQQEKLLSEKETALERKQQEAVSLETSLREKEQEVKKLSESLEAATAKLEESKQLLKTNENVINWLNKQMNDHMISQQRHGPFEMQTNLPRAQLPLAHSKVPPATAGFGSAGNRTDILRHTDPQQVAYKKPVTRHGMLPPPVTQSTPNIPTTEVPSARTSASLNRQPGFTEPILDAKYFNPAGNVAASNLHKLSEPPLMSAYFPKPSASLPAT